MRLGKSRPHRHGRSPQLRKIAASGEETLMLNSFFVDSLRCIFTASHPSQSGFSEIEDTHLFSCCIFLTLTPSFEHEPLGEEGGREERWGKGEGVQSKLPPSSYFLPFFPMHNVFLYTAIELPAMACLWAEGISITQPWKLSKTTPFIYLHHHDSMV